ncbi:MAG: glycosyltransferase family 2 protein [Promethearchaeota archaeon]
MEESLVSVIVINYNGQEHLKECFDSLYNQNYENTELILIDNDSKDNSVGFIKSNYDKVKVIQLNDNYGFAKGNNIAASKAKGNYIVFLNNDTYVDKNWLTELVKIAKIEQNIGIVASKIYYYNDKNLINYAGGSCDKYGKSHHIGENKKDHKLLNVAQRTFYACGASLLIKREIYKKISLFDPYYFMYCEDLDLCWRAWIFGYKVIYAPKSFIFHKIGHLTGNETPRKKFLGERNLLRTVLKNYEFKTLFQILPIYFGKRIGLTLKLFIHLDKNTIISLYSYIKAFFWNLFNLKSLIKNRKAVQLYRTKNDKYIFQIMEESVKLEATLRNL